MRFFIPSTKKSEIDLVYQGMVDFLKDQLRVVISDRKIFSITYIHDKKEILAQVGQLDQKGGRYEIMAIFESNPYIIYTQGKDGGNGVTILVDKNEIAAVKDFD